MLSAHACIHDAGQQLAALLFCQQRHDMQRVQPVCIACHLPLAFKVFHKR